MRTHRWILILGAGLGLVTAYRRLTVAAKPAPETTDPAVVWQIGRADGSSDEFAKGSAEDGLRYEIGSSEPGEHWRETQEGKHHGGPVLSQSRTAGDPRYFERAPRLLRTVAGSGGESRRAAIEHDPAFGGSVAHAAPAGASAQGSEHRWGRVSWFGRGLLGRIGVAARTRRAAGLARSP